MSVTLATARREVARRAQEFISGTATGGSTTTLADVNNLTHADGYWRETTCLVTSGVNNEQQRRAQSFTASTSTLTMYSAFTGAVASGVTYELYRRFTPTDVLTGINRAINIAAPDFREHSRAVATAVMDTLQYAVPSGLAMLDEGLITVEYQMHTLPNQTTWPFTRLSTDLYEFIEDYDTPSQMSIKKLQLRFNPESNRLIRLVYDGPLGNVSTGTDTIHLDLPELEWLYTQAVAELWRIEASRTVDSNRKSAIEELARWESASDKLRRQMGQEQAQQPLRRTQFRVGPGWR